MRDFETIGIEEQKEYDFVQAEHFYLMEKEMEKEKEKDILLKETAILQNLLKNKSNIQQKLVAIFKQDFEELEDIYLSGEVIMITSSIIDLYYTSSTTPFIENALKIKETPVSDTVNTTVEDFMQHKINVKKHTEKAKAILQEILEYMERESNENRIE